MRPTVVTAVMMLCAMASSVSGDGGKGDDGRLPDLEFRARVRAKEMIFDCVTTPYTRFHGTPGRETVDRSTRRNLPKPVEPGKVYRDVEVEVEVSSRFSEYSSPLTPREKR